MEIEFLDWYSKNEDRFAHGQFDEKQIAYSAWLDGKNRNSKAENLPISDVMCRASFRGEATKEQLYIILEYIDDMKQRGYVFEKHERTDLDNGNVKLDYVLALHGT